MKNNNNLENTFLDLNTIERIETFQELPNSRPLILSNLNGQVLFANNIAKNKIKLKNGDSILDLNTDPKFDVILNNLNKGNVNTFSCDLSIKVDADFSEGYNLNFEKVNINHEDLFIIYFNNLFDQNEIAKKVNTYNQALESVNVGVMIADEMGYIKYLSNSFEKFLSTKIENVYNKSISKALKNYLSTNELDDLKYAIKFKKTWIRVITNLDAYGEVSYRELRLNSMRDNIDKSVNFILAVNDNTGHIKQSRLIKKSELQQKSIINNISDPILIVSKVKNELIFENANNSFYKNILQQEINISEIDLKKVLNENLYNLLCSSLNTFDIKSRNHIQFYYSHNPTAKKYNIKITFTDDNYDNTRLFIINMVDITEQLEVEKKLKEAYKKEISLNKLKSSFLANMSHEIRTPLNAIVGYSEMIEDEVKEKNIESSTLMTTFLKEGVNRLLKLVDNVVEVSLLESGNIDITLENVNIKNLLLLEKKYWIEEGKKKEVKVLYEISDEDLIVLANEEKLQKALSEILDNAIKYNEKNGYVIIRTKSTSNCHTIEISDSGIGIKEENIPKTLELFEQLEEGEYCRKYEGAGLGLSIANKLIFYMNGKLKIHNNSSQGVTISVSLPRI